MAAIVSDERAPSVSAALRRRIGAALDAGERPSLQMKNLRLGSIVLQRTDCRDAPALREVALQMARRGDTAARSTRSDRAPPCAAGTRTRWTLPA